MNILVFNCGSSSQGFKVYRVERQGEVNEIVSGKAKNVATPTQARAELIWNARGENGREFVDAPDHFTVAGLVADLIARQQIKVDAIGHRFVHGGDEFSQTALVDAETLARLKKCFHLAPIHNRNSFSVINACLQRFPDLPQYAVFDTAFHARLPEAARQYALPRPLVAEYGFRKYGFHGLSYQYVSSKTAEWLGRPLHSLKLIICHLGTGGASVAAIQDGHSIDTSMGYSPLQGLVMSTRCGDVDAEIVLELVRQGRSADEISQLLNYQSGLLGVSGVSSNLEEVIAEADKGNPDCQLAFDMYVHRLKLYLGAFTWLLNGADALVFTDDVGLNSWRLREAVCAQQENLGIALDRDANRKAPADRTTAVHRSDSRMQILLVPTDEERVILDEVVKSLLG